MKERAESEDLTNKPQAWWVQKCLRTQDFSIVIDSDLSPKRKLYIAHSLIIKAAVETRLLEDSLKKEPINNAIMKAVALMQLYAEKNLFWSSVLSFASENIHDGIYEEGSFKGDHPLLIAVDTGANSIKMYIEEVVTNHCFENAADLERTTIKPLMNLASSPINSAHSYKNTGICPVSQQAKFQQSSEGKKLIAREKALDKRIDPKHKGYKKPSHPVIQEHVKCPALAAGVFPELTRLAALKVLPPAQPDD